MWDYIQERVVREGNYIVETGCTVRACAKVLGTSKSTVHKDVTERLAQIDQGGAFRQFAGAPFTRR